MQMPGHTALTAMRRRLGYPPQHGMLQQDAPSHGASQQSASQQFGISSQGTQPPSVQQYIRPSKPMQQQQSPPSQPQPQPSSQPS